MLTNFVALRKLHNQDAHAAQLYPSTAQFAQMPRMHKCTKVLRV